MTVRDYLDYMDNAFLWLRPYNCDNSLSKKEKEAKEARPVQHSVSVSVNVNTRVYFLDIHVVNKHQVTIKRNMRIILYVKPVC